MSVISLTTACIDRGRVVEVFVEADIHPGLPVFSIIGFPDRHIEEAKERIRGAQGEYLLQQKLLLLCPYLCTLL